MQIIVFFRFEDPRCESARVCKYAYVHGTYMNFSRASSSSLVTFHSLSFHPSPIYLILSKISARRAELFILATVKALSNLLIFSTRQWRIRTYVHTYVDTNSRRTRGFYMSHWLRVMWWELSGCRMVNYAMPTKTEVDNSPEEQHFYREE